MYVCVCRGITDKQIKEAVLNGAGNLRELKKELDVASQCGKCVRMAQEIIDNTVIDESLFKDVG